MAVPWGDGPSLDQAGAIQVATLIHDQDRVLITGGAGYVGSVLVGRLLAEGHQVTVVDDLVHGVASLLAYCGDPGFRFVRGDVRDESLMKELVREADVIVPLAAVVGAPACDRDPRTAVEVNLEAVCLVNRLRSVEQLVIFPTTNSGYGTQSGNVHCTEETPLQPISLYGRTKVDAEDDTLQRGGAITFRLATVFGSSPRMRTDLLVNHFVLDAVRAGYLVIFEKDFKRNFVHVRDVADCFLHAMSARDAMVGRPFNLGLDEANLSKEELAQAIQRAVPSFYVHYAEIGSDPDKRNYIVSNERLRLAGFAARRTVEEGIEELIHCYRMVAGPSMSNV